MNKFDESRSREDDKTQNLQSVRTTYLTDVSKGELAIIRDVSNILSTDTGMHIELELRNGDCKAVSEIIPYYGESVLASIICRGIRILSSYFHRLYSGV